jgi:catechol 2,3-dioxygenase-like lactoylglutathione lyase family enzyme
MESAGIHHVALCVTDLDAALAFYVGGLHCAVLPRPDFDFPGAWLGAGNQQIHLMVLPEVKPDRRQHLALQVDDVDAWCAHLEGCGITVRRSPAIEGAGRQAFVVDPSGNRVELNQPG